MPSHSYLALAGAIIFELIGISFLQASQQFTRPGFSIAAIVTQGAAMYLFSIALRTIPVGVAYAMWCGLGIALIAGISFAIFKQQMDFPAVLGISLIAIGAVLITGFSQTKLH